MPQDYLQNFFNIIDQGMQYRQAQQQAEMRERELALRERQEKAAIEQEKLRAEAQSVETARQLQSIGGSAIPEQVPMPVSPMSTAQGTLPTSPVLDEGNTLLDLQGLLGGQFQVPLGDAALRSQSAQRRAQTGTPVDDTLRALIEANLQGAGVGEGALPEEGSILPEEFGPMLRNLGQRPAPLPEEAFGTTDPRLAGMRAGQERQAATTARQERRLGAELFDADDPVQQSGLDRIIAGAKRGEYKDLATAATQADKLGKGGARELYARLEADKAVFASAPVREKISEYDGIINHLTNVRGQFAEVRRLVDKEGWGLDAAYQAVGLSRVIKATATMLPKAFGETGRLSDQDVERALLAMPGWFDFTVAPEFGLMKLDNALKLASTGQRQYLDTAFATFSADPSGRVQRDSGGGGDLGSPVATSSKPDGMYQKNGKTYRVVGGKVYEVQ